MALRSFSVRSFRARTFIPVWGSQKAYQEPRIGSAIRAPFRAKIAVVNLRGHASGSASCTGRLDVVILAAGTSRSISTAAATPTLAHLLSGRASGLASARARARIRLDTQAIARAEDADWMLLL